MPTPYFTDQQQECDLFFDPLLIKMKEDNFKIGMIKVVGEGVGFGNDYKG